MRTTNDTKTTGRAAGLAKKSCAILALLCATSRSAEAQWERLDKSAPHVIELVGAVNLIVDRWPIAAQHYEILGQREPDHPLAYWLATRSLVEAESYARALKVGEPGMLDPRSRASLALELARAAAQLGNTSRAVEYLKAAREAELVMPSKSLSRDERLKSVRNEPIYLELIASVEELPKRFAALADADDHEGLMMLWHSNATMEWTDISSTMWLLKDVVDEHSRALDRKRAKEASLLATRLKRGARAADEALGTDFHGTWIARALAWNKDQRKENASLWKKYKAQGKGIRSHQFAKVLDTLDELDATAMRLGDLPARYIIDRTRGMVHSGILNYGPARKGVARDQEYSAGRAAFQRQLDLSMELQDVHFIVDAYDFLATFETQQPHLSLQEAEQLIFGGIIATARVEPAQRNLGMFEEMWRDLQQEGSR